MIPSPLPGPFVDPLRVRHRAQLEQDRRVVMLLAATVEAELLPAVASDRAPGWHGPARATFELRRQQLVARLQGASAGLDAANAALAVALAGLTEWP